MRRTADAPGWLALLAATAMGCAAPVEEAVGSKREQLVGGVPDLAPGDPLSQARRDAVVRVFTPDHSCTGTLITPRLVVTAYHCAVESVPTSVRFGVRHDGTNEPGFPPADSIAVRACLPHPEASGGFEEPGTEPTLRCGSGVGAGNRRHDAAVLVLAERVEFGRTNLPTAPDRNYPARPLRPSFATADGLVEGRFVGFGSVDPIPTTSTPPGFRQVRAAIFDFDGVSWTGPTFIRVGDSGGPVLIRHPDVTDPVVGGVLSGIALDLHPDLLVASGPNFTASSNRDWLVSLLETDIEIPIPGTSGLYNIWTGPVDVAPRGEPARSLFTDVELRDPDGDGLVGDHDNCPLIFNPAQVDEAEGPVGDGLGDAVYTRRRTDGVLCTVTCAEASDMDADGILDPCDNCPNVPNPGQDDCDSDGVGDACTPDTDGDGIVDPCDGCPELPTPSRQNCNRGGELADGAPRRFDPCDPNACATGAPTNSVGGANDLIVGEGLITTGEVDSTLAATMETGFRFCPCTFGPGGRSAHCERPPFNCLVERNEFSFLPPATSWRSMTLTFSVGEQTGTSTAIVRYDRPSLAGLWGTVDYEALWDFRGDATAAGTLVTDLGGGAHTSAVFWNLAVDYAIPSGLPVFSDTCNVMGGCPALEGNLNSHYWADVVGAPSALRFRREDPEIPPIAPAFLPSGLCPTCSAAFPIPMLTAKQPPCAGPCPPPEVFARFAGSDFDITESVTPSIAAELASGELTWVGPVEPRDMLTLDHLRLVGVDPTTLEVRTLVSASTGRLAPPTPQFIEKIGDPPGAVPILRATRNQYMVVGGIPAPQAMQVVDLTRGIIEWWPLWGARPTDTAAATIDAVRRRMYVVDRVQAERGLGHDRRLLLVDLDTGIGTVLVQRPATPIRDSFALAAALDGSFVLAVSNAAAMRHTLHWLVVDGAGRLTERSIAAGDGVVVGQMSTSGEGVSMAVQRRGRAPWRVVGTRWTDFHPRGGRGAPDLF